MEGQLDVIRAYTIGVKNCVASLGTAFVGCVITFSILSLIIPNLLSKNEEDAETFFSLDFK